MYLSVMNTNKYIEETNVKECSLRTLLLLEYKALVSDAQLHTLNLPPSSAQVNTVIRYGHCLPAAK